MIVGLAGYATSGKNAVASFMDGFEQRAFADPLREALRRLNPWLSENLRLQEALDLYGSWDNIKAFYPEARRLLQAMGTEVGRELFGPDFWVDQAIHAVLPQSQNVVFTDVRFPNEAQAIRDVGGEVWWVQRAGVGPLGTHISERSSETIRFDLHIANDGTLADLERTVHAVLRDRLGSI